jgi:hypothetical protein
VLFHEATDIAGCISHGLVPDFSSLLPGRDGGGRLPGGEQVGIGQRLTQLDDLLPGRIEGLVQGFKKLFWMRERISDE